MTDSPSRSVRVDWTVPVWGVVGLLIQGIGLVWFLASLSGRVTDTAGRVEKQEARIVALEGNSAVIARLDERTTWIYNELRDRTAGGK